MPNLRDQFVGPDLNFPLGKPLFDGDKGGINVAHTMLPDYRRVILDFGATIGELGGPPLEVKKITDFLRDKIIKACDGKPPGYNKAELPIKVVADLEKNIILLKLPTAAGVLVANYEVWLALAEVVDEAVQKFPKENV